jgi:hypothetical protein
MRILKSLLIWAAAAALFCCVLKDSPGVSIDLPSFIEVGRVIDHFYDIDSQTLYLHLKRDSGSFVQKRYENFFKVSTDKIYFKGVVDSSTNTIIIQSSYPDMRFDLYSSSDRETGETKMLIGPLKPGKYNIMTFERNLSEQSIEVSKELILGDKDV